MKRFLFLMITLCLISFGCYHSPSSTPPQENYNEIEYNNLSSLAYIGGSVVYNPENLSVSQLKADADIAFYLSKVKKNDISATVLNGTEEESREISSVVLDESEDIYGYLNVISVSERSIFLRCNMFSVDDKRKTSKLITIYKGEQKDINNDGKPDLEYKPLVPVRTGFSGAMCLTFISNPEELYTSMYAIMEEDTLTRSARNLESYSNQTFYGMNSNGDFIYILNNDSLDTVSRSVRNTSDVLGMAHGDYVIDGETGEMYAVVGTVPERDDDEDTSNFGEYELKAIGDYEKAEKDYLEDEYLELEAFFTYTYRKNQFASEEGPLELLKQLPKSLLRAGSRDQIDTFTVDEAIEELNFVVMGINPDDPNSIIIGSVIEEIAKSKGIELSPEEKEEIDNVIYAYAFAIFPEDVYEELMANRGNDEKIQEIIYENWNNLEIDVEKEMAAYLDFVAMNRSYIENTYPESPKAIVRIPELSTVYPLMSLSIGDIPTDLNQTENLDFPSASEQTNNRAVSSSRAVSEGYSNYLQKKSAIDKEFEEFYSIELTKISIKDFDDGTTDDNQSDGNTGSGSGDTGDSGNSGSGSGDTGDSGDSGDDDKKDENNGIGIKPSDFNSTLKLGITGSFNSRWGHLDSSLATAVYISADGNFKTLQKTFNLYEKELVDKSHVFFVGPIPITVGFTGEISIDVDAEIETPVNFAVGFVGMYGGGASFSVDYGVTVTTKWLIPIPYGYCDGTFDLIKINHTEYYVGPVVDKIDSSNAFGGKFVITPSLTFAPSIAIGPKYAYAGIRLPLSVGVNLGYGFYHKDANKKEELAVDFWNHMYTLGDYENYGKLSIGTKLSVCPVVGVKIPIIDKKIELKWNAATLFSSEVAFTDEGIKYVGEFVGKEI